jgi:glycine oxidase
VQVIVIGAGVIGCAAAHALASRGARVRVVDPRPIGGGATHASAGMLAPYSEGHDASLLRLTLASLALYDGFVSRLRADTPCGFEYDRGGTLQVAHGEHEAARLAAEAKTLAAKGAAGRWLDRAEAVAFEPALATTLEGALLLTDQGYVDAPAMTAALADAAQRQGARFSTGRVLDLHDSGTGAAVTTPEGTIEGDAVVVAAGSWSSAVAGVTSWPTPVKPVRGQLLRLHASSRVAGQIIWGSSCYVVPWQDGTILVGATVEDVGFDEHPTAHGVRHLLNAVQALLPAVDTARFGEVRVGLRPKTPDELPMIGRSSTMRHVFHATGHYRNGILLTPLTAALIADLVLDGRAGDLLALTDPARFGL